LPCQLVDIRALYGFIAITSQFRTKIVNCDEKHVGVLRLIFTIFTFTLAGQYGKGKGHGKNKDKKFIVFHHFSIVLYQYTEYLV
jgi:hypothetical protein